MGPLAENCASGQQQAMLMAAFNILVQREKARHKSYHLASLQDPLICLTSSNLHGHMHSHHNACLLL